ncbi:MAG: hypothetical protein QXM75_02060, partial [Candidatus Diapherotrites archaeon]
HPILKDLKKDFQENIYAFYIRISEYDMPLRVETLISQKSDIKEEIEKVASVVYALSKGHREYSYPFVLIEADLHARLMPQEVDAVMDRINSMLNSTSFALRRNRRPFD